MIDISITEKEADYILDNNFGKVKWLRRNLRSDVGLIIWGGILKDLKRWNRLYYEHYIAD